MNGLPSNARRALLRPANPRDYAHTVSRIIGAILPVTIASTLARLAHGAFMGFTTRRRVSIPPPLTFSGPTGNSQRGHRHYGQLPASAYGPFFARCL